MTQHNEINPPAPVPVPVPVPAPQPANEPELVAPVIDHAEKIATLEQKQNQQAQDFYRRISETEDQLRRAIEEGGRGSTERIAALEDKIAGLLAKVTETAQETPPAAPAAPAAPQVAVETPAPEVRYVRRNGRKVKARG